MNPEDVKADTPVRAILDLDGKNHRAYMTRLAMLVFGKSEGQIIRAYTQFSPQSLAALIEARRKGIFDYGEAIRKLDIGAWTFPKDPAAVLKALDQAESGNYDEVDLASLGLADSDGEPIIDLTRVFPTRKGGKATTKVKDDGPSEAEIAELKAERAAAAKAQKEAVEKRLAEEKARVDSEESERRAATQQAAKEKAREVKKTATQSGGDMPVSSDDLTRLVDIVVAPLQEHIAVLSSNMGETLEGMHNQNAAQQEKLKHLVDEGLGRVLARQDIIQTNQLVLAKALAAIDQNMRQILMYFVDPDMEFEDMPLGIDQAATGVYDEEPELPEEEVSHATSSSEGEEESDSETTSEESDSETTSEEGKADRHTRETLEGMELPDIRSYAESIGVTPARWHKTNVNRILAEYDRLDKEG